MLAVRRILGIALAGSIACAEGQSSTPSTTAFDPSGPASSSNGTSSGSGSTGDSGPATTNITTADDTGKPGGDCCQASATPGCDDPDTQSCVCTIEPACCQDQWDAECVDLAGMTCGDPSCRAPATGTDSSGETTEAPPPTLTCDELGAQEGWDFFRCEGGGGTQCNGMGTPTIDCDFCCEVCGDAGDVSCGELSVMQGWAAANCEWNGNGACGGVGTPTCDCNACCQAN